VTTAADAVERLLLDPAERLRQRAAADQLLDEYRFERVVEQLDAIYAEARVS
jgi:hypothetical protein